MGKWSQLAAEMAASFDNSDISPLPAGFDRPNVTNVTNVKAGAPACAVVSVHSIRASLAGLDPECPRGGIAPAVWSLLVWVAADLFNDFAVQASGLGWNAANMFGVVPDLPTNGGLVARMANGWRVVALDAHRAVLRGRSGGSPGWHYRRTVAGSVLLWELSA
jgi:hypothetical protein